MSDNNRDTPETSSEGPSRGVSNPGRVTLASSKRGHILSAVEDADWLGDSDDYGDDDAVQIYKPKGGFYVPEF